LDREMIWCAWEWYLRYVLGYEPNKPTAD
jgi:hypothetical protein